MEELKIKFKSSVTIFGLLLKKLDINGRTSGKKTLLHIAVEQNAPLIDIAIFLLEGADINLTDKTGRKPSDYYSIDKDGIAINPNLRAHHALLKNGLRALCQPIFQPLLPRLTNLGYDVREFDIADQQQEHRSLSPSK